MSKNDNYFVQVTMTPEQARTVVQALDVLSRIHMGQFDRISEPFWDKVKDRNKLLEGLLMARKQCFPELAGNMAHSHGIAGGIKQEGKVAYDLLQVIRQCEAFARRPEGGLTVDFDAPLWVSDSTPRPTAKPTNVLDRLADI